ncbi:hypothetical protein [Brevundimonas faecalis]|uniref:Uncharacterized protein n=1 Tax=Brevundimonas faecalis TaxID=947378 RepID=A0ABV2R9L0_9CAUL
MMTINEADTGTLAVSDDPRIEAVTEKADVDGGNLSDGDKAAFIGALQVSKGGFWTDEGPGAVVWRVQDRFLFGDAVQYTGGRFGAGAGLGTDWLTTRGANYFAKNAQVMGLTTNRIGALYGSWTPPGVAANINMGFGAVTLNEGAGASFGRAGYFEALHYAEGGASAGIEVQGGNFTTVRPTPSAYGVGKGYHGLYLAVQGGVGYVVGNANTPIPVPTQPSGTAIDVAGGEEGLAVQRWVTGLTFRNGGLYRGVDGLTGTAKAVSMAIGHELVWEVNATQRGATIRSDVTGGTAAATGLIFTDSVSTFVGSAEVPVFRARHTPNGVNYMVVQNATTGSGPLLSFIGSDADVHGVVQTKGAGILSFRTQGGASEGLRVAGPTTAAATNYISATAVVSGGNPYLIAAGTDANAGIDIRAKGGGANRLISGDGTSKVAVNNTGLGFFATAPAAKPVVTGSRGGNAALASLLAGLAALGLITDSTTA